MLLGVGPLALVYHARNAPFHPDIHNMSNVGPLGYVHAHGAWMATRLIDTVAYDGRNIRAEIAKRLAADHVGASVSTWAAARERSRTSWSRRARLRASWGSTRRERCSSAPVDA